MVQLDRELLAELDAGLLTPDLQPACGQPRTLTRAPAR
jgi:hypothetical protein